MLGDVLKNNVYKLQYASNKKNDKDSLWVILRNIAVEEIVEYGGEVDSDIIIPIYYKILCDNLFYIPPYYKEIIPSNKQERFRVVIRNIFSSNAFHKEGLANHDKIYAYKTINDVKKGNRIIYRKK